MEKVKKTFLTKHFIGIQPVVVSMKFTLDGASLLSCASEEALWLGPSLKVVKLFYLE